MNEKLIKLLRQDSRTDPRELASMLGVPESEVTDRIAKLERDGVIRGYTVLIDEERLDRNAVTAQIELKVTPQAENGYDGIAERLCGFPEIAGVQLMSGNCDLLVTMRGSSFRDIAFFVSENLATIDGVMSTRTKIILRRYKEEGVVFGDDDDTDERGKL
ncbi:MAG: Lrp/AsnC family transcriptional regulator [Oscillospiraceae bacterium]|jgi:DNA-binding Lrp family transcriptional regulator|nr:Lrp/AsnC family transcriptional regulator [Oscillospiraceae bacterium]